MTLNVIERVALKLHRIILLCFFSDLANVTMAPNTNYFQLWRHQIITSSTSRKPRSFFENIILEISECWTITNFDFVGNGRAEKPESPFNKFLESLNMRSISSRKNEMGTLEHFGNDRAWNILKIRLICFRKS